jgi:hypothetical protein
LPRAKEIASPTRDMTTVPDGEVETAVHMTRALSVRTESFER